MKTTHHFDPDTMRARFQDLKAAKAQIIQRDVGPLREQLDSIVAKIQALEADMKPIDAAYREKRETLVPIDREMAIISRALAGKTSPDEAGG